MTALQIPLNVDQLLPHSSEAWMARQAAEAEALGMEGGSLLGHGWGPSSWDPQHQVISDGVVEEGAGMEEWTLTGMDDEATAAWSSGWGQDPKVPWSHQVPMHHMDASMASWGHPGVYSQVPPYGMPGLDRKADPAMSSPLRLPEPTSDDPDSALDSFSLPEAEDNEREVQAPTRVVAIPTDEDAVPLAQGMSASKVMMDGRACTRVEWIIEDFCSKLQATMNRHLVSPAFNVCGLSNLRLMLSANTREILKGTTARGNRGRKGGALAAMSKLGPLQGSLKLKAEGAEEMSFNLTVGKERHGPLHNNFSSQVVHGVDDFGVDWLKEVDKVTGSLTVGIEIVNLRQQ